MTSKTGSIGEFMRWTKRVVADPAAEAPKQWFEDTATAETARGAWRIGFVGEAGIVPLEAGVGRTRVPRMLAHRVTFDLDLVGAGSPVAVEAAPC